MNKQTRNGSNDEINSFPDKEVLTFDEASKFLDLSPGYLYKLTSAKKIRYSKPNNKKIYFSRNDLIDYMLSNPIVTSRELNDRASTIAASL